MTSTVSNNKTVNPLLHNWKCGVRSKLKIATLLFALHITAAPMVIISGIINIYDRGMSGDMVSMFAGICAATTSIAGVIGIFIAIDSFNCLNTKSFVDMKLSLPMTARGRFLSNFLAGFTAYVGPFLAAQVITVLCMLYGLIFMDGRTFETAAGYDDMGNRLFISYECEYFGQYFPALLKLILCGVLVMLMMYTLAVFTAVCCGNKFESIAYTVIINILIPMTVFYVTSAMFDDLFGIEINGNIFKLLIFSSPAGGAFAAAQYCLEGEALYSGLTISFGLWAVGYLLITAALFGLAFLLYRKRRADQVSKPFAFKFLYHIVSFMTVLLIYSLFYLDDHKATLPAIVTTLIAYIVMEFAANRGFKRVWLSAVKYVGTIGFSILLMFAVQQTEGFGAVERIPDISQIESVELHNYGGFYSMFSGRGFYTKDDGVVYSGNTLVFTEQENIQTILKAHQSLVDNRKNAGKSVNDGIRITYTLKNGKTFERSYIYNDLSAKEAEILSRIDLSEEFRAQVAEKEKWHILNAEESWRKSIESSESKNQIERYAASTISICDRYSSDYLQTQPMIPLFKRGFLGRLAEAYSADIMDINEENYYLSDNVNVYVSFYGGPNIVIPESFTRTLKVYEDFGFGIPDRRNVTDNKTLMYDLRDMAKEESLKIFTAEEWRSLNDVPDGMPLHSSYNYHYSPRQYDMENLRCIVDADENFLELYRNAQPMNIVPDDGYIIYVSGNTAVVPKELNGIAEKAAASAKQSGRSVQETVEVPIQNYY